MVVELATGGKSSMKIHETIIKTEVKIVTM